jgi:hypothetical protein
MPKGKKDIAKPELAKDVLDDDLEQVEGGVRMVGAWEGSSPVKSGDFSNTVGADTGEHAIDVDIGDDIVGETPPIVPSYTMIKRIR